jgi:hypothetical protein
VPRISLPQRHPERTAPPGALPGGQTKSTTRGALGAFGVAAGFGVGAGVGVGFAVVVVVAGVVAVAVAVAGVAETAGGAGASTDAASPTQRRQLPAPRTKRTPSTISTMVNALIPERGGGR